MIFNACNMGINIDISELSLHTLMAVNEYAAKMIKSNGETELEPMSFSELRNKGRIKG